MPRGQEEGVNFEVYLEFADTGKKLNEYKATHQPASGDMAPYLDVYVESETSKGFKIITKDLLGRIRVPGKHVFVDTVIDGRQASSNIMSSGRSVLTLRDMCMKRDGKVSAYPLTFSAIDTVANPSKASMDPRQASVVGTINIRLIYGTRGQAEKQISGPPIVEELGTVFEKAAKMGSMVKANLDLPSVPPKIRMNYFDPADCESKPFYEFRIHYCERVVLKQKFSDLFPPEPEAKPVIHQPGPSNPAPKKRARSSSVASSGTSSSSSSSSSSDADEAGDVQGMMAAFMAAVEAQSKAKADKKREAKKEKKEKRKVEKQKRREEKAKKREGKSEKASIDLTDETDGEAATNGAAKAAEVGTGTTSVKVKKEMLEGK